MRQIPPAPSPATLTVIGLVIAALVALRWVGESAPSVPGSPDRADVEALLDVVRVIDERPSVPGYERDCGGGSGCVFGPAWSDHHDAPGGRSGCSTRDEVLRRDLTGATHTGRCDVEGGTLRDPYSGRLVDVARTGTRDIHVDHVIPLSAAWDLGAAEWDDDTRLRFANDIDANLLAVTGSANMQKGDLTPGEWMPSATEWHCFYAARYLTAAVTYDLPVTRDDHRELARAAGRCPG